MLEFPDEPFDFELRRFSFEDSMGEPFSLSLMVQTRQHDVELRRVVGTRVAFELDGHSAGRIEGIVREVHVASVEPSGESYLRLEVVPPLWLASRRVDSRIFQHRSVPQIVGDVIASHRGAIPRPVERLTGTHAEREYCAQYGETDLDFMRRILSEEGITSFWYRDQWVLVDDTPHATLRHDGAIRFAPPMGDRQSPGFGVTAVSLTSKLKPSRVALRDYDFRNPTFALDGSAETPEADRFEREDGLEIYGYELDDATGVDEATLRASRRLDATRAAGRRMSLTTNMMLRAGTRVEVEGHPRADVNVEVLAYHAMVTGEGPTGIEEIRGHFDCVPASEHWRPRLRRRPRIMTMQTAVVVPDTPGEEIDVDSFGRVLVEFRWDRRALGAGSSRRVRVSQGWAGPDYGLVCLPRVGDEVVIDFLDGDPDQPLVVGRVHNGRNVGPLTLPAQKTVSVWQSRSSPGGGGHNRVLLEDQAGHERVEIHAHRNYQRHVGVDSTTRIGHDRTMHVGGDTRHTVDGDHNVRICGDSSLVVEKDRRENIDGELTSVVGKNESHVIQGSLGVSVDGDRIDDIFKSWQLSADKLQIVTRNAMINISEDGNLDISARYIGVGTDTLNIAVNGDALVQASGSITVRSDGDVRVAGGHVKIN